MRRLLGPTSARAAVPPSVQRHSWCRPTHGSTVGIALAQRRSSHGCTAPPGGARCALSAWRSRQSPPLRRAGKTETNLFVGRAAAAACFAQWFAQCHMGGGYWHTWLAKGWSPFEWRAALCHANMELLPPLVFVLQAHLLQRVHHDRPPCHQQVPQVSPHPARQPSAAHWLDLSCVSWMAPPVQRGRWS